MRLSEQSAADDVLSPYRERVMYWLGLLGVMVLLPLAANDFLRGLSLVGVATLALVLILGVNAFAAHRHKSPPIPMALVVLVGIATIGASVRGQGIYGVLWSYPAVLFFYFCTSRRLANVYNLVLYAMVSAMVYRYMDAGTTLRFMLTMMVVIISSNVFLGIIGGLQHELLEQSIVDALTGAFNRRHMDACLEDAIERKRRTAAPNSLLLIDIDHFKSVNDRFGHAAGDVVLKALVALIEERSRRLDVLFRMGGEEFVLYLPDTDEQRATIVGEHLRASVTETELLPELEISISVGVSALEPEESVGAWLRAADVALYQAKRAGRNRVVTRSALESQVPRTSAPSDSRVAFN